MLVSVAPKVWILADGHQLAETVACVAKPRKVRSHRPSCRGFLAEILLHHIVAVDSVFGGQYHVDVCRALVEANIGQRRTGETGKRGRVTGISGTDQISRRHQFQRFSTAGEVTVAI